MQDNGSTDAYDGDEELLEDVDFEDMEGVDSDSGLEDDFADLIGNNSRSSQAKNKKHVQKPTSNKRKASQDLLEERAIQRQRFDDGHELVENVTRLVRSRLLSNDQQAFGERDVQELGHEIAAKFTDFMNQSFREPDHLDDCGPRDSVGSFLQIPGQQRALNERSTQLDSVHQTRFTPTRRSLWASSKPWTPVAEIRRRVPSSRSQIENAGLQSSNTDQEIPIDPVLLGGQNQSAQQQEPEVIDDDPVDASSLSTVRPLSAAQIAYALEMPIKDEPDYHPGPGGAQDSVEFAEAGGPAAYSANTKRRLEQSESTDMSSWRWTEEQDELLLQLKNIEDREWPDVVKYFPTRSYRTIQQRYYNLMKPAREDNHLQIELARQKALNRKLMRENAAHRGIPYVEPSDDEPMQRDGICEDSLFRKPANEHTASGGLVNPSMRNDTTYTARSESFSQSAAHQEGEGDPKKLLISTRNSISKNANRNSFLFAPTAGQGRGDQAISDMVAEDEFANDSSTEVQLVPNRSMEIEGNVVQGRTSLPLNSEPHGGGQGCESNDHQPPSWTVDHLKKWGPEDDQKLLELRFFQRRGWPDIATHFPRRTFRSMQQRYYNLQTKFYLDKDGTLKMNDESEADAGQGAGGRGDNTVETGEREQRWSNDDLTLLRQLKEAQHMGWDKIAEKFPGRTIKNIRQRYYLLRDAPRIGVRDHAHPEDGTSGDSVRPGNPEQTTNQRAWELWESDEEWTLHQMRDIERKSWHEIWERFPHRTKGAVQFRYYTVAKDLSKKLARESFSRGDPNLDCERENMSIYSNTADDSMEQRAVVDKPPPTIETDMNEHTSLSPESALRSFRTLYEARMSQQRNDGVNRHLSDSHGPQISQQTRQHLAEETPVRAKPTMPETPGSRLAKTSSISAKSNTAKRSRRPRLERSQEAAEVTLDEPWKPFPITPSTVNPRTNQLWTPTAMKEPLFPPKQSTDELLRAIANGRAAPTPKRSTNQPSGPAVVEKPQVTHLTSVARTQAPNAVPAPRSLPWVCPEVSDQSRDTTGPSVTIQQFSTQTISGQSALEQPTPQQPTPRQPTPEQPTPEQPTPEQPILERPTPEQPTPKQPTPEQPSPEQSSLRQPTPKQPTPKQPTLKERTRKQSTPRQSTPHRSSPSQPSWSRQNSKHLSPDRPASSRSSSNEPRSSQRLEHVTLNQGPIASEAGTKVPQTFVEQLRNAVNGPGYHETRSKSRTPTSSKPHLGGCSARPLRHDSDTHTEMDDMTLEDSGSEDELAL